MIQDLILAVRNVGRNRRRSLVTVLALALCSAGLVIFTGYVSATFAADESRIVGTMAHLQIFRRGFVEKGIGNPVAFAIEDHEELREVLKDDPEVGPMIRLVSPRLIFTGLASHYENDTSTAFLGIGSVPEDWRVYTEWNPKGLVRAHDMPINRLLNQSIEELDSADPEGGTLGVGLAKILGLPIPGENSDEPDLKSDTAGKSPPAQPDSPREDEQTGDDLPNFDVLESAVPESPQTDTGRQTIELLCAPRSGAAPNVQTLGVRSVRPWATAELNERLLILDIRHASKLLFPGEPVQATSLMILLNRTDDTEAAASRIREILAETRPDLECRSAAEMSPFSQSVKIFLRVLFIFMFGIIATIVIFTIYNTLAAAIVERTSEIGTIRAMGVDRGRVARLFVMEGFVMGIAGGLLGVALALGAATLINASEILFMAPTTSYYMQVEVLVWRDPIVLLYGFLTAVVTAVISAILPALHAARLPIVDALRHA